MPQHLDDLARRLNFERSPRYGAPPVFVVADHRAVIPVIWAALEDRVFDEPPLLVRFDAHDDMGEPDRDWAAEEQEATSLDGILRLADQLRSDAGGWVAAAMQLGLVSDVATFYVDTYNYDKRYAELVDHDGRQHRVVTHGRFSSLLGHQGSLTDLARPGELGTLWETLRWDPRVGFAPPSDRPPVWFDVDLDFAIHHLPHDFGKMPWRWEDFEEEFLHMPAARVQGVSYQHHATADILVPLLRSARLVTIATERHHSAGFAGVHHICTCLHRVFRERSIDWFDL